MQKRAMRELMRSGLNAASPDTRRAWSDAIGTALSASDVWRGARSVLVYLGDREEPDLDAVIRDALARGVRVGAPRMDWDAGTMSCTELASLEGVEVRRHGIREPVGGPEIGLERLDLALVPGLAFDRAGRRLGRGAGFYDRFLGGLGTGATRIGVGFGLQVVPSVPRETHDLGVDALVTEDGFMLCGRG